MNGEAPSSKRVAVVGSANQDLTSYTSTVPVLGETVMGSIFQSSCGGKGSNQARAAASLGITPVTMICRVGKDVFGENLLQDFRKAGVEWEEDKTVTDTTSSGVAAIVVDEKSGDNMIIVTPGANHALSPADVEKSLKSLKPAVVVVQLEITYEAALQALKTGQELGAITILNPAPAPNDKKALEEFYPYVDILIPNETELRTLCGVSQDSDGDEESLAKSLLKLGVRKSVICTLGARGAMIVEKVSEDGQDAKVQYADAPEDLPARQEPVKDTIGAGDAFCGSLSTYLTVDGMELKDAVVKACGFASMSVRRQGATYPKAHELPDSLRVDAQSSSSGGSSKPEITFVTGNKNKLKEVKQILSADTDLAFEIVNLDLDLPELQGDPVDIAQEKCRQAAKKVNGPCFIEDTSLCFNALNGMPGPYIKYFLEKCGHDGLNAMLAGFDDKTAYAQTVIAFCPGPDQEVKVFYGRTEGTIVPPRGSLEFGWDPIFQPNESNGLTYAEMNKNDKNAISHRGRAMEKFRKHLLEQTSDILKVMAP
ncbi:hypothetical protein ACA910_018421 [Epithemia clementina (nom. ined.)]